MDDGRDLLDAENPYGEYDQFAAIRPAPGTSWADQQIEILKYHAEKAEEEINWKLKGLKVLKKNNLFEYFNPGEQMDELKPKTETQEILKKIKNETEGGMRISKTLRENMNIPDAAPAQVQAKETTLDHANPKYCKAGKQYCNNIRQRDVSIDSKVCMASSQTGEAQVVDFWTRCPVLEKAVYTIDPYEEAFLTYNRTVTAGTSEAVACKIFKSAVEKFFTPKET